MSNQGLVRKRAVIGKNFMEVKKDPDTFNTSRYPIWIESIQLLATVTRRFVSESMTIVR